MTDKKSVVLERSGVPSPLESGDCGSAEYVFAALAEQEGQRMMLGAEEGGG